MIAQCPSPSRQGAREPDLELFQRAKKGEKAAAVLLFDRYAGRFRAIVCRILASRLRNIFDPDDLIQEVAVVLLAKPLPPWINSPADFTRYVGGIAKNIALAQNRKHLDGRHHSLHREVPLAGVGKNDMPASQMPSVSDVAEDKETLADLLARLPLRVLEVVAWICAGYSVAEIAFMCDMDEETVVILVCAANNFRLHAERKIRPGEVLRPFKRRTFRRRIVGPVADVIP